MRVENHAHELCPEFVSENDAFPFQARRHSMSDARHRRFRGPCRLRDAVRHDRPASRARPIGNVRSAAEAGPAADQVAGRPDASRPGECGQIQVPKGFKFTGIEGTKKFEELLKNPVDGKELGVMIPDLKDNDDSEGFWFVLFEFDPIGYVKDGEQANLNAQTISTILDSIRQGTESSNQERRRRGWPTLSIVGWEKQPFYDPSSHNLVWGIRTSSMEDGKPSYSINYNTRILGREGVLSANLVVDPNQLKGIVPTYEKLVTGVSFKPDKNYAAFAPATRSRNTGSSP